MTQPHITAVILTYNEAAHIVPCIESVRFAERVLVFDSLSTDNTQALAREAGAIVEEHPFENYSRQRNAALEAAARYGTDWVLFVDADERITPELAAEVRATVNDPGNHAGYRVPRHNYIFGKLTLGAGWFPDYQLRLLKVGASRYDPARAVHEYAILDGDTGTLQQPLIHDNYQDVAHFHDVQRRYSRFDAQTLYENGERLKPWTLVTMPIRHFIWRYITLKGYRDGWHGFTLSLMMARYEFRKYRLLGVLRQHEGRFVGE
jgi:(heptosyl)LPS beta-1,4-glucosyltransferase